MSPVHSSDEFNGGPSLLDQVATALGQDYLKLIIDDSADCHEEQDHSSGGYLPLFSEGVADVGNGEPGTGMRFNQTTTTTCDSVEPSCVTSEKSRNGQCHVVYYPPPDIVLESLPSRSTGPRVSLGINGSVAGTNWDKQKATVGVDGGGLGGRSKVKRGHSRTRQKNIHCLETEV